ncbi:glutamate-5-semialdehyde dehydrogenase [Devriesea agamarum]|uniref:glutamate-5-semialdehyde dehydrogenase n=1 Tax=Devriesea agamarum TaxID=472569 RepID=UPI00071C4A33|nr:glutamate-5-semialdehyde dehydrogenase [Devriesea agamarum]
MSTTTGSDHPVLTVCRAARTAQQSFGSLPRSLKDDALHAIADRLLAEADTVLAANQDDLARADAEGISPGLRDRLHLTPARIEDMAAQLRATAALADPVGEVRCGSTLANGLQLQQVRVPLGVVGMIYEARPNVTIDAAGLALKSGNAVVLRGGSAAAASNTALVSIVRSALVERGLSADLVAGIDAYGREGVDVLLRARGLVDVVIPRGGAGLIKRVVEHATVPTIETGTGNCHIVVDRSADLNAAVNIVENAKTQKVGACNAVETVLVVAEVAGQFLPTMARRLAPHGVTLHVCPRALALLGEMRIADKVEGKSASANKDDSGPATDPEIHVVPAGELDWETEYLSLDLAVRVVDNLDEAISHVRTYSTGHTEAIITGELASQQQFIRGVDAAVVMTNASTRFSDGGEFGFGAEIGISTQKLHARGPMGLPELTTGTWHLVGTGHIRP